MNYIFEKLLLKDIGAGENSRPDKMVRRMKRLALLVIALVFLAGAALTARYALSSYNALKADFLAEPAPIADLGAFNRTAVWFTKEEGDPRLIQGILVYLKDYDGGQLSLDIVNVNDIPVELISVQDKRGDYEYLFDSSTVLEPSPDYQRQSFTFERVNESMLASLSSVVVNYRYDDGVEHQAPVIPFKKFDEAVFEGTSIRTLDNTALFDFIGSDSKTIFFKGRSVQIDQPLYIPAGKTFVVSAGQEIDLINEAFIVSRAPIQFEGTASQPARMVTSDGTGRGLLVLQAQEASSLRNAIFDGLDTPVDGIWGLTGAVTFYESDVTITNSSFINNTCEDGLNIIRSTFTLTDSYFSNTASDAFDADFCEGTISNSIFENTTNDAIDVSGSTITVRDVTGRMIGDKGVSAGENSRVILHALSVDQAVVGIASKDFSNVTGEDITISNTRIALTLYVKKPEYGPAQMTLENVTISGGIDFEYLIQRGARLVIDGKTVRPRSAAKEALLFEKMINGEPIQ